MKQAITITLDKSLLKAISTKTTNKSKYIEELIKQDLFMSHVDTIANRTATELLSNELFIKELTVRVQGSHTTNWGA